MSAAQEDPRHDIGRAFWLDRFVHGRASQPKLVGLSFLCSKVQYGIPRPWDGSYSSTIVFPSKFRFSLSISIELLERGASGKTWFTCVVACVDNKAPPL